MQKNNAIKNTIFFFGLLIVGVIITFFSVSAVGREYSSTISQDIRSLKEDVLSAQTKNDEDENTDTLINSVSLGCTDQPVNTKLEQTTSKFALKTKQLQEICGSGVSNQLMTFIDMPNSPIIAGRKAVTLAEELKTLHELGITPIVIVEPVTEWGLIEFEEFGEGFYNGWLEEFFARLINEGVTQEMMGVWVPFPEANLPYWNKAQDNPAQFGINVNLYAKILRKYYPQTEISVLLNSVSYQSTDFNWEKGVYDSLIPYLETLDKGLVSSFGIQGFPWRSPKSQEVPLYIYDPVEFISPNIAIEAADYLGVKKIWINTGTFRAKFASDPDELVVESASTRKTILDEILTQAKGMKAKGYDVSINLFAENKVETTEATDWSYWGENTDEVDAHTSILKSFLHSAAKEDIEVYVFDKHKD